MRITHSTMRYSKALSAAVFALLVNLALVSYSTEDYSIMYDTSDFLSTHNYLGLWGAQLAGLLFYLFGGAAWTLVALGMYISYKYLSCTVIPVNTIFLAFIISMLVSAYIQVYPGACGIVLLELLQAFLEPWQVVLFLFCLLCAFAVLYALEPLYRLYIFLTLRMRAGGKSLAKLYMLSVSHEQK